MPALRQAACGESSGAGERLLFRLVARCDPSWLGESASAPMRSAVGTCKSGGVVGVVSEGDSGTFSCTKQLAPVQRHRRRARGMSVWPSAGGVREASSSVGRAGGGSSAVSSLLGIGDRDRSLEGEIEACLGIHRAPAQLHLRPTCRPLAQPCCLWAAESWTVSARHGPTL